MSTKISVIFTKNDGTRYIPKITEKRKIARSACLNKLKSAYLKVEYRLGCHNDGTYYTKKDFLQALNAFTEPALIKYMEEWE